MQENHKITDMFDQTEKIDDDFRVSLNTGTELNSVVHCVLFCSSFCLVVCGSGGGFGGPGGGFLLI